MKKQRHGTTEYFLNGGSPRLLILSGMHGDEREVIACVDEYVKRNERSLPDFLFIPQVSPSAVSNKTRRNRFGRDINRSFIEYPIDEEAQCFTRIVSSYRFNLCVSFHEDADHAQAFYLYDSANMPKRNLSLFRGLIEATGATLFTGVDDPDDPLLGFSVNRGYVSVPLSETTPLDLGFSSVWLLRTGVAKRVLTPEIPGKAPVPLKGKLVAAILTFFCNTHA